MAKTRLAKSSRFGRHPVLTFMVYCAMAIVVVAFVVGLHVQSGVALMPSILLGIVLLLVVGSCEFVIGRARRATQLAGRVEHIEAALAEMLRENAQPQPEPQRQSASEAQFVHHVNDLNMRLSTLERLAEEFAEQTEADVGQQAAHDTHQIAAFSAEIQRLSIDLDRLDSRIEAVVGQMQSEGRDWQDRITSELKLLETLVKQMAERLSLQQQNERRQQSIVETAPRPPAVEPEPAAQAASEMASALAEQDLPAGEDPMLMPEAPPAAAKEFESPVTSTVDPEPVSAPKHEQQVVADSPVMAETPVASDPPIAADPIVATGAEVTVLDVVRRSIEANRIDLYLQPIVTLPQRKVRYYEALTRLRDDGGELILPSGYLRIAEQAGMMPLIDNIMLFRSVQVLRRLGERSSARGVFCNISVHSLVDAEFFPEFISFMEQNRSLADSLTFEFTQDMLKACGPIEQESLQALSSLGFHFSLDHVHDLDVDFRELHERNFRYIKIDSDVFLNRMTEAGARIHPADMRAYLERFGLELIVEKIEDERSLTNVLDHDVGLAQGYLFSEPRPVRPEVYGREDDAEAA